MFSISASSSASASSRSRTSAGIALQAGDPRRAPAPLAGDQLVGAARPSGARARAAARPARPAIPPAPSAPPGRSAARLRAGSATISSDRQLAQLLHRRRLLCSTPTGSRSRPRPIPGFGLATRRHLLRQLEIGLRAGAVGVVMGDRQTVARRLAHPHVARDHGRRRRGLGSARAPRARHPGPAACGRRASSAASRRPSGAGSARAAQAPASRAAQPGPRARSTRSAPGTITLSAATSALTVSGPSEGGQSSRMYSKRSLIGARHVAQAILEALDPRQLDVRAGQARARRQHAAGPGTRASRQRFSGASPRRSGPRTAPVPACARSPAPRSRWPEGRHRPAASA